MKAGVLGSMSLRECVFSGKAILDSQTASPDAGRFIADLASTLLRAKGKNPSRGASHLPRHAKITHRTDALMKYSG
jgi:hypothetical protein